MGSNNVLISKKSLKDLASEVDREFQFFRRRAIKTIPKTFTSLAIMYWGGFVLGVSVVIAAIIFAFIGKTAWVIPVFIALGLGDIIVLTIIHTPEKLLGSRAKLIQLQGVFYNWCCVHDELYRYIDMVIKQGLENPAGAINEIKELIREMNDNTERMVNAMQNYKKTQ